MLIYILKFSACLAIFLIFYKSLLEKESVHLFKRFYLLSALLLSIGIPLITFTEYVVVSSEVQPIIINDLEVITNTNWDYLTTILWSVYGLGVLIFGVLFLKNLIQILFKINQNTKVKSHHFTNV
ncbi:peptidase M56, partial [Flavobacteriaceae bacterium AH-315-B10]|nr:peptidase M56 [Flavobacteriaceae bacterium AH-315-B10]